MKLILLLAVPVAVFGQSFPTPAGGVPGSGITQLTGGVTAAGSGAVAATVADISSAAKPTNGNVAAYDFNNITTVLHDLVFSDATYDIGKSGATRPRDGFFSRNLAIGGTLNVTGHPTLEGVTSTGATGTGLLVFGSSPIILTPTIASFLNATHNHGTAAAGGTLAFGTALTNLSGDITTSGSSVATLPTVNANVGSFGDATHVGTVTINAKGQVIAASSTAITAGTGNSASNVAATFSATPTFTCGSATAGTTSFFRLSTALTANITSSTLASCTPGQTIAFHIVQDATGGRTVAMPTGFDALPINLAANGVTDSLYAYDGTNGRLMTGTGAVSAGFGMTPSGSTLSVNTAIIPSAVILQSGSPLLCASASSSGTAYTCLMSPTLTTSSLIPGAVINWVPDTNGTAGAVNLNIDTLGNHRVKELDGSTDPAAGDIVALKPQFLWYDGTVFRMMLAAASASSAPFSVFREETANIPFGAPATVYSEPVPALATNKCYVIAFEGQSTAGGTYTLAVDATVIATLYVNANDISGIFKHCNITGSQAAQRTYASPGSGVFSGGNVGFSDPPNSGLATLTTTQAIDWTTGHTISANIASASGTVKGGTFDIHLQ